MMDCPVSWREVVQCGKNLDIGRCNKILFCCKVAALKLLQDGGNLWLGRESPLMQTRHWRVGKEKEPEQRRNDLYIITYTITNTHTHNAYIIGMQNNSDMWNTFIPTLAKQCLSPLSLSFNLFVIPCHCHLRDHHYLYLLILIETGGRDGRFG